MLQVAAGALVTDKNIMKSVNKNTNSTNHESLISEAKSSFNELLRTSEYQKIISDDFQCERLIELLKVQQNGVYLDLATGTGYVGFKIAEQFSGCSVVGLDIADEVISENLMKVKERGLSNIEFRIYDGIAFPNFRTKFDGVICRYALHHFPKIHGALGEIKRVLKDNGRVIIADAIRNEHDKEDFINKFQGLKKDGHVRMYTRDEILSLFRKHNFIEEEYFDSKITFSRELSPPYEDLLKATSPKIKEKYFVKVDKSKVTLTFDILNVTFIKKA